MSDENKLVLRGLSPRLLKSYLVKLEAVEVSENRFEAEGWAATLDARKVPVLKSEMDEIEVTFDGEPDVVAEAIVQLRKKTLRGGG